MEDGRWDEKSHDIKIVFLWLWAKSSPLKKKKSQSEEKAILLKLILYCVPISKGHKFTLSIYTFPMEKLT